MFPLTLDGVARGHRRAAALTAGGRAEWQAAVVALIGGAARPRAGPTSAAARSTGRGGWRSAGERYFVKTHAASRLAMLEAEAEGLRALARPECDTRAGARGV